MIAREILACNYLWIQFEWLECGWMMSRPNGSWQEVDQFESKTDSGYKSSEVVQLQTLLKMWGSLGKMH